MKKKTRASKTLVVFRLVIAVAFCLALGRILDFEVNLPTPVEMYKICGRDQACIKIVHDHGVECFEKGYQMNIDTIMASQPDETYWNKYISCLKGWGLDRDRKPSHVRQ